MRHFPLTCLTTAALLTVAVLPLEAQVDGHATALEAKFRSDCRLASQVLLTGHPAPRREWALRFIGNCEVEGADALIQEWKTADRSGELELLVRSSIRLRDARLYRQLRETARDVSSPPGVRVAAMLVLTRYTDPLNAIWLTDLRPPSLIRRIPLILSSSSHGAQVDGAEPVAAVAGEVLALLEEIAAARQTESEQVWYAAAVLARRVRRDIEGGLAH